MLWCSVSAWPKLGALTGIAQRRFKGAARAIPRACASNSDYRPPLSKVSTGGNRTEPLPRWPKQSAFRDPAIVRGLMAQVSEPRLIVFHFALQTRKSRVCRWAPDADRPFCKVWDRSTANTTARRARLPLPDKLLAAIEHPSPFSSIRAECAGYGPRSGLWFSQQKQPNRLAAGQFRQPVCFCFAPCRNSIPGPQPAGVVHAHQPPPVAPQPARLSSTASIGTIGRRSCHPISSGKPHTEANPIRPSG